MFDEHDEETAQADEVARKVDDLDRRSHVEQVEAALLVHGPRVND